jgi:hypothetical protein
MKTFGGARPMEAVETADADEAATAAAAREGSSPA